MSFADLVLVGRVVKPQGRRGEVAVEVFSDRPDRFPTLRRAFVPGPGGEPREVRVEGVFPHKGRYVVKIEGVDSIDAAETLRGLELRIPDEDLSPLPEGSYYHHQLAGLAVVDEGGEPMGTVEEVVETAAATRILVVRDEDSETLLPFADAFVRKVDLEGRRIVAVRPEYVVAN
jgi:16S rRNA processing protein RimM